MESRGAPADIVQRGYSLMPMDISRRPLRGAGPTPGDAALLKSYAESPWMHIKMARVCSSLASVGFSVNKRDQRTGALELLTEDHPLWMMLRNPNPQLTGYDFRFLTFLYARMNGEVYWRVKGTGLGVSELWVYPKSWVRPVYTRERTIDYYEVRAVTSGGFAVPDRVLPRQMIWMRRPDPEDPYGKGIGDALSLATEIDTFELASESDRRFFENDAQPPGALIVPGMPTDEERRRIRDDWQAVVGGPERQGSIPVLAGGMDFKQFRQGRKEMDFIEGQRYLRDVIIGGVHKHILGITEDVNLASAKAAEHTFARWELRPDILWLEAIVNSSLSPLFDERAYAKWDNPVPADEAFELEKSTEGLLRGAIKRNEWRKSNGFEEVNEEEGNVYLLPLMMEEVVPGEERRPAGQNTPQARPANSQNNLPQTDRGTKPRDRYGCEPGHTWNSQTRRCEKTKGYALNDAGKDGRIQVVTTKAALTPQEIRSILDEVDPQDLAKRLAGAYQQVVEDSVVDAYDEIGAEAALDVAPVMARRYATEQAMERVTNINQHTREALQRELDEGLAAGESIPELSRRVNAVFDTAKSSRGELIARTETIAASNWGALESYKSAGVEYKEWLLAPDYDEAEDGGECAEIASVGAIPINDDWDGIDYPPLHPNCRCAVAPVFLEPEPETSAADDVTIKLAPAGFRFRHLWAGDKKQIRITSLGVAHARMERMFGNVLRRAFQAQQRAALKVLRREAAD